MKSKRKITARGYYESFDALNGLLKVLWNFHIQTIAFGVSTRFIEEYGSEDGL